MSAIEKVIGKVTHYYDKIGVAIVRLEDSLSLGDTIKFVGKDGEFTQAVSSMQIEHKNVETAKKGQEVGIQVDQKVKDNAIAYAT